jgi:hypothetical protein
LNDDASSGTVELTGEFNSNSTGGAAVTNPLGITMDNVTFPSKLSSLVNSPSPAESTAVWGAGNFSGGTGQYVDLTVGPGQVSSNFLSAFNSLAATSSNNDNLTSNIALSNLNPPACNFTYLAPELTGPNGLPQTIVYGSTANVVVILTPSVSGAAYPTGTVTLTDGVTGSTYTGTFTGTGDTLTIPVTGLAVGTHSFGVTSYTGDSNYTVAAFGSYAVTVNLALSPSTSTLPSGTYGASYSTSISASGGVGPYTYSLGDGSSLPPGLILTASGPNAGLISGTPTSASNTPYSFTIDATDSSTGTAASGSQSYSLTINQAPLTVTANNFTITYGSSLPTYTVSYTGFVNGDTAAALTGTPLLSGAASANSGAGTYAINVSAAGSPIPLSSANYTFTFVNGTLTINKAPLTVTANNFSITYGSSLPTYTVSYTGFVNGDTAATLTGTPLLSGAASANSGAGTYAINVSAAGLPIPLSSANYTFTFLNGTLTINKATPTVSITSGGNATFVDNAVTFTASASFATAPATIALAGPTGTVTFQDGGTALNGCTAVMQNTSGTWTCTLNSATAPLSVGSHSIVAVYGGDNNFVGPINSTAFSETVADFSITTSSNAVAVFAGSSVQFTFTVSPVSPSTTFPAAISLVPNGLPAGSTYTFSPSSTVPACTSSCSTVVTLTVKAEQNVLAQSLGERGTLASRLAPFSLALLLLPFAGWMRKTGKRFSRSLSILLLIAGAAALAGISGCNLSGFSGHSQKYTVTVTGTSGTLSHTSPGITLTIK